MNGRGGRNPAEMKLVDGMWTETSDAASEAHLQG